MGDNIIQTYQQRLFCLSRTFTLLSAQTALKRFNARPIVCGFGKTPARYTFVDDSPIWQNGQTKLEKVKKQQKPRLSSDSISINRHVSCDFGPEMWEITQTLFLGVKLHWIFTASKKSVLWQSLASKQFLNDWRQTFLGLEPDQQSELGWGKQTADPLECH